MKKKPDKLTDAEYVEHKGSRCPACGSDDIMNDGSDGDYELDEVGMRCHCLSCNATWTEVYTLLGYDNLVEES